LILTHVPAWLAPQDDAPCEDIAAFVALAESQLRLLDAYKYQGAKRPDPRYVRETGEARFEVVAFQALVSGISSTQNSEKWQTLYFLNGQFLMGEMDGVAGIGKARVVL
jgi:hypothetical protein